MLRCGSSGKPGDSEVESSPEEVYRAYLTNKAGAEILKDTISMHERTPETGRGIGIVACMLIVFLERYRHFHLDRFGKYLDLDTEFGQRPHNLAVEGGNRHGFQRGRVISALRSGDVQYVGDKVEVDGKRKHPAWDGRGSEAARGNVEGGTPAVVDVRGEHQPDFADDLRPHVKRVASLLPIFQRGQPGPTVLSVRYAIGCHRHFLLAGWQSRLPQLQDELQDVVIRTYH